MDIQILKCHGSGNDFFLIDELGGEYLFTEEQRQSLIRLLCDRQGSLGGADGLLFVQDSPVGDARMRFFNPDGSEAEMCGNGVRCVGRYVIELTGKRDVLIETMKTNILIKSVEEIYPGIKTFDVALAAVSLDPSTLPMEVSGERLINEPIPALSDDLKFTALSIPNPHIVAVVDTFEEPLLAVAEQANRDKGIFPRGVNVSYVKVLEPNAIFVLTYERGVGVTNSCGTAMSASSYVSCLLGHAHKNEPIRVYNKGGMVRCLVEDGGSAAGEEIVHLIGNATYVFTAEIRMDFERPDEVSHSERKWFAEEEKLYSAMVDHIRQQLHMERFWKLP
jgi:diaminopimelate epimerase